MQYKTLSKRNFLISNIFIKTCVFIFILFSSQSLMFSQSADNSSALNQNTDDESNIEKIGPTSCESLLAALDVDLYSKQKPNEDSKIIIIFRMHKVETLKHYIARKEGLASWFENRYPKRVIYAKGDITNDYAGRADIYFNGKKVFIIKFGTRFMGVCTGDLSGELHPLLSSLP